MSTIKDGGPAFPGGERWRTIDLAGGETNHSRAPFQRGLSLRDYFAAKAMQGELASQDADEFYDDTDKDARGLAQWCYQMADAMLAAREAKP